MSSHSFLARQRARTALAMVVDSALQPRTVVVPAAGAGRFLNAGGEAGGSSKGAPRGGALLLTAAGIGATLACARRVSFGAVLAQGSETPCRRSGRMQELLHGWSLVQE
mmetsp:Transcript_96180/g.215457  ORF Transcript_96180/g.215457 Transcript_96180/m.215457 type:complete len:109 (-) Transcript_96180:175-501(-)